MASLENAAEETFTFCWNIMNLRYNCLKTGQFIESPSFSFTTFQGASWHLRFYPNGADKISKEYFSLFLHRKSDTGPEKLHIRRNFITPYRDKISFEYDHPKNFSFGCKYFLSHTKRHLVDSFFPITCKIHFDGLDKSNQSIFDEKFISSPLKSEIEDIATAVKKLKFNVNTKTKQVKEQVFARPKKCIAQTLFCAENKVYEMIIEDKSITSDNNYSQIFPVIFSQTNYSLNITLSRKTEFISVYIHLIDGMSTKPLLVLCRLSFLFNGEEPTVLFEDMREFLDQKENVWTVEEAFKISDLETKLDESIPGNSKLKFEFTFANGDVHSVMLKESSYQSFNDIPPSNLVSTQMKHFYDEKKMCDVVIKIRNKTFHAHKLVLSLMSPVFSAMFSSEMEENKTGVVIIKDFDEDVVSNMISFFYTETLTKLEFEMAEKLFAASDKYQIVILKNLCRKFLIENLTWENICSILCLADLFNDLELENAAVDTFCFYKDNILLSDEWKKLEQENMSLSYKFLKKCISCK